jgi:hypothetical protein
MSEGAVYPYNFKNCGNCEYWEGERKIEEVYRRAITASMSTRGRCGCKESGWHGNKQNAGHTCPEWTLCHQLD